MSVLMVQQKAPDYARWREHFDSLHDQRQFRGMTTLMVARDTHDTDAIVVLFQVDNPERMREHIDSSELANAHEHAGVVPGSTRLTLLEPDGPIAI